MGDFRLGTAMYGDRCDLRVTGEVDVYSAGDLAAMGMVKLTEAGVSHLVVDLAGVTFIDSTGLGALVRIRNRALEFDKAVTFRDPSPRVQKLFKLTGLDGVFAASRVGEAASPLPG